MQTFYTTFHPFEVAIAISGAVNPTRLGLFVTVIVCGTGLAVPRFVNIKTILA